MKSNRLNIMIIATKVTSGQKMKITHSSIKRFILTALAIAAMAVATISVIATKRPEIKSNDREFIAAIKSNLKRAGDAILLKTIHPGNWTKACFFTDGVMSRDKIIEAQVGVPAEDIDYINRKPVANDSEWSITFFHPPKTIETILIPNRYILAKSTRPCLLKAEAAIALRRDTDWDWPTIELLKIDDIKEKIID